jgi:hypothetical protein
LNQSIEGVANVVIAVEWVGVALYFVNRFIIYRKTVSLALAAMAFGWVFLGLGREILSFPSAWSLIKLAAAVFGASMWYAIWRVEKTGN